MKLEILMLNEVSQKDKYHIMITYIWNGIYSTNEPFHRKETHGHGEQTVVVKREGREWEELGIWG